jgi:hypothetical protein
MALDDYGETTKGIEKRKIMLRAAAAWKMITMIDR